MHTSKNIAFGGEFLLNRKEQRSYMVRTNSHGLIFLLGHFFALSVTGCLVYLSIGSLWIIPSIFGHGFIMAFLFAPVHECSHGTAFRSRPLNEIVYWIVSFIYVVPPTFFRYSHATHHTYTQIRGYDPDMVLPVRATIWDYAFYVSALPFFRRNILWFLGQSLGRVHSDQQYFLPDNALTKVYFEARLFLLGYAAIAITAIVLESFAPVLFWIIPRLVGEPFMRWIRVAEHSECPEGPDLRKNTRTTNAPTWLNLLFWNMPYHAEHHLFPKVPFHELPRLHSSIGNFAHPVGENYFKVHGKILKNLMQHKGITWEPPYSEQ